MSVYAKRILRRADDTVRPRNATVPLRDIKPDPSIVLTSRSRAFRIGSTTSIQSAQGTSMAGFILSTV
jgi:hypothetical protein